MATNICRGDAKAVAQVDRYTISGTVVANDVYTITCNTKSVSYTAQTGNTASVVIQNLILALQDANRPAEFADADYVHTVPNAFFDAVAVTAGVPFTFTVSVSNGAGGSATFLKTTPTVSRGPQHLDDPSNWSLGTLPVNGDDIVFPSGLPAIQYGLGALSAVTPASVQIFSSSIGLEDRAGDGEFDYLEYRVKSLQFAACSNVLIQPINQSAGLIRLHFTSSATITVDGAAGAFTTNLGAPFRLTSGTGSTGLILNINSGSVSVAAEPGETGKIDKVRIGTQNVDQSIGASDEESSLFIGSGVTVGTVVLNSGVGQSRSAISSLTMNGGTWTQWSGGIETAVVYQGTLDYRSSGNLGATGGAQFLNEGVLDLTGSNAAFTLSGAVFTGGSPFYDPQKRTRSLDGSTSVEITIDAESLSRSNFGKRTTLTVE